MALVSALICIFIGGIINGSFALPTKNIRQWSFENLWFVYSFWAFLILPWAIIFILAPSILNVYGAMSAHILWLLIMGGLLFGIGQACFAQALKMIGFGLSFVINIGIGTGLGFLLPLVILHPGKILSAFGMVTLSGSILILAGLLTYYNAGKQRDTFMQHMQKGQQASHYQAGVLLTLIAGICSAIQNFVFADTHHLQIMALHAHVSSLAASLVIWPIFLTFSFIPYASYMLYLQYKKRSFSYFSGPHSRLNVLLSLGMGLFWYGSLVLYSKASSLIGPIGPIVAWPLFMVLIILTSNFWGWKHHEWDYVNPKIIQQAKWGVGLLILAVAVLAYSAVLA